MGLFFIRNSLTGQEKGGMPKRKVFRGKSREDGFQKLKNWGGEFKKRRRQSATEESFPNRDEATKKTIRYFATFGGLTSYQ